jgi:hypothetical protein
VLRLFEKILPGRYHPDGPAFDIDPAFFVPGHDE